jgi:hypothetical protein
MSKSISRLFLLVSFVLLANCDIAMSSDIKRISNILNKRIECLKEYNAKVKKISPKGIIMFNTLIQRTQENIKNIDIDFDAPILKFEKASCQTLIDDFIKSELDSHFDVHSTLKKPKPDDLIGTVMLVSTNTFPQVGREQIIYQHQLYGTIADNSFVIQPDFYLESPSLPEGYPEDPTLLSDEQANTLILSTPVYAVRVKNLSLLKVPNGSYSTYVNLLKVEGIKLR